MKARHLLLVPPERRRRDFAGEEHADAGRRFRLGVRTRFGASVLAGLAWAALSAWVARGWTESLAGSVTFPVAAAVVAGIAIVPGYLAAQLLASLVLDRPSPLHFLHRYPPLTLLIASHNEEERIEETLAYALRSDYPGELTIVVADDGSTDSTCDVVRQLARKDRRVRLVESARGGKAKALNVALGQLSSPLVATIDADTILMPYALRRGVARLLCSPSDAVAVAGSVLVRNSRDSLLARIQEWDYFLGMASVKRQQALLQGAVVTQSAFSIYDLEALRAAGGWPDRIRGDVVLSLAMIRNGGRTTFEPTAIAFTSAPTRLDSFVRQRQRWARGVLEGLREHGGALLQRRGLETYAVAASLVVPCLDAVYTVAVIPGIVLAAGGNFSIVGPLAAAVLPMSASISLLMLSRQRLVFRRLGLRVRWNPLGFAFYLLGYQLLVSPVSLAGYVREVVRTWRGR